MSDLLTDAGWPPEHPAPWWRPVCGRLECWLHQRPGLPSAPAPRPLPTPTVVRPQLVTRRRRRAPFPWSPLRGALRALGSLR